MYIDYNRAHLENILVLNVEQKVATLFLNNCLINGFKMTNKLNTLTWIYNTQFLGQLYHSTYYFSITILYLIVVL